MNFGIILMKDGDSLSVAIPERSLSKGKYGREEYYDKFSSDYIELALFKTDNEGKVITSSVVIVPEDIRINKLL